MSKQSIAEKYAKNRYVDDDKQIKHILTALTEYEKQIKELMEAAEEAIWELDFLCDIVEEVQTPRCKHPARSTITNLEAALAAAKEGMK